MPQFISGKEIAENKEHDQVLHIQSLKEKGIVPQLAIIQTISSPVIDTYIRVKKVYAEKVGIQVLHYNIEPEKVRDTIEKLNNDKTIHGIIVQLPLDPDLDQDNILNSVVKSKDVDGLAASSAFIPPTVQAIIWLLEAYVGNMIDKKLALVGRGRLVGAPLEKELLKKGLSPKVFTKEDNLETLSQYNVIISATGVPRLLGNNLVSSGTYLLDAGTAEENGAIHGDADDVLYDREDIFITPTKGGVGILTVRALFENTLLACEQNAL